MSDEPEDEFYAHMERYFIEHARRLAATQKEGRVLRPMFKMDGGALAAQELNAPNIYRKYLDEQIKITPEELKQAGMKIWDEVHPEDDV